MKTYNLLDYLSNKCNIFGMDNRNCFYKEKDGTVHRCIRIWSYEKPRIYEPYTLIVLNAYDNNTIDKIIQYKYKTFYESKPFIEKETDEYIMFKESKKEIEHEYD